MKSIDAFAATVQGNSIEEVSSKLVAPYKTESEKFRAIFRWVTLNISYDVDGYLGKAKMKFDSLEVFKNRTGVCSGYASLLRAMCRIAGIECVGVTGMARSDARDSTYNSNHEWVAVKLEQKWWLTDPTWASGSIDWSKDKFERKFNEFYYLSDPALLILSHYPTNPKWQLLNKPVAKSSFLDKVYVSQMFFQNGYKLISPLNQDTCFQNILPIVVQGVKPNSISYFPWEIGQYGTIWGKQALAYDNDDGSFSIELTTAKTAYYSFEIFGYYGSESVQEGVNLVFLRALGYTDEMASIYKKLNLNTCKQKIAHYLKASPK